MAIYEVLLRSAFRQQVCINRWNYVSTGDPGNVSPSFGLATVFGLAEPSIPNTVFAAIKALVSVGTSFLDFQVANLYDPTDFYVSPFFVTQNGAQVGQSMSPVLAIGYRTNRVRADIHRGTKRFVGVPEDKVNDGGVLDTTYVTGPVALVAEKMSEQLTYAGGTSNLVFTPAVLSREEYETPRGNRAYRKYADPTVQLEHTAIGVLWERYTEVRSQTSRQYGRGV